jgi:hypothetical protein
MFIVEYDVMDHNRPITESQILEIARMQRISSDVNGNRT